MKYDILITDTRYLAPDMTIKEGTIAIKDGRYAALLGKSEIAEAAKVIHGGGLLWMPGLTDGHTHTSQQLLRGRLLDEKPVIWKRVNVPFESCLDEEDSAFSAEVAALEMIRSGTTSFVDAGGKYPSVFASVFRRAGLRGRVTRFSNDNATPSLRLDKDQLLAEMEELISELEGDELIKPIYSVTALTAASSDFFTAVFKAARSHDIPVEVHMNEYGSEVSDFIGQYGLRPFEYLEENGLLEGIRFTAPHCIFLSHSEMEIIRRHDIRVAHCPFSNCGKGVPDTPTLLSMGIRTGFGSDGAAHGGLDLFKEMRLFRGVMNATRGVHSADSQIMSAETLLRMATAGGAGALHEDKLGYIGEGMLADLIAIDASAPHLWPTQNLVHSIVESADGHDVKHMIVNGRLIMENRNILTLDEQEIMEKGCELISRKNFLSCWK